MRAGLLAVMRGEPGLVPIDAACTAGEGLAKAQRTRCTVALVDYHLREEDGLNLCRTLKTLREPPHVLIYSSFVTAGLTIPASLAGADGLVDKAAPAHSLFEAIRAVSRGRSAMPPVLPELMQATATRLDAADLPILGMTLGGTPRAEIADALGLSKKALEQRLGGMLSRLKVPAAPTG